MNSVCLVGRLTKEPELRKTNSGKSFTRFTLAVNRSFSSSGEKEADFISCIAWNKTAENLCKYMTKGSLISLEGSIQTGSYEDNSGKTIYTTDILVKNIAFLEKSNKQDNQQCNGYSNWYYDQQNNCINESYNTNQNKNLASPFDISLGADMDDDMPY